MSLRVVDPEVFGVTESSVSLFFGVEDGEGPVPAEARILIDGECRATSEGLGTRSVRIDGLEADVEYRLEISVEGAPPVGAERYFSGSVRTHPAPRGAATASFATLNDLHFGEPRFGGQLTEDHEYGEEASGFPMVRDGDTDVPYWSFMNEDAIAEINQSGVDAAIIKGDIADQGRTHQFEAAAKAFAGFAMPHHAFLGNHDYYGRHAGEEVDGYALLGQTRAPRTLRLGGWQLVLLETTEPGEHHGVFHEDRLGWLEQTLDESREADLPTLLLMHHHPVPPEHADRYPNTIGLRPEHSLRLFDLIGCHPQVRGVLIGHTHRNRMRRYPASGPVPFVEVNCTKDYPGGWAHYRLFEDGSFRQEVRRTSTPRALEHSTRCRHCFRGFYRDFALGDLDTRSFATPAFR
jgi:predicted phosphodiesterase